MEQRWPHYVVCGCSIRHQGLSILPSDSDQPVASRRVQAFVIPQICEKVQQKEIDPSYKSPEASVPEMKRRQVQCPHSGKRWDGRFQDKFYWSLNSLFYWTFVPLSYWFSFSNS
ncbi:hypothetical protein T01_12730 [Trichinella spiralis]|uniref:Uncharacterized protein n=1 Tax=Trichinella spiralis TaxID=6334 RepID=A0A0V1APG5_TRISP|nr:hypothetical protein T01_12730 [Trichinella spiralis]